MNVRCGEPSASWGKGCVVSRTQSAKAVPRQLQSAPGQHERWNAVISLRHHWPEYLMEAGELALYMFAVCAYATLLKHPQSPLRHIVMDALARRVLMGLAAGATVIGIVMSPWAKQSGGHFNPAIT